MCFKKGFTSKRLNNNLHEGLLHSGKKLCLCVVAYGYFSGDSNGGAHISRCFISPASQNATYAYCDVPAVMCRPAPMPAFSAKRMGNVFARKRTSLFFK